MSSKSTLKKSQSRHRNRHKIPVQNKIGPVLLMAVLLFGGLAGGIQSWLGPSLPRVLAYATNVNRGDLLTSTNQQRAANGLAGLGLNDSLNSAAQAKANDMVAKNYWSHDSPDGRQPWDFITAAGYSYSMAGENLAYGALSSESTVQAWMNSPGHRANILKPDFLEVGFGYANSPNFQGSGEQTVIVAMYAKPYAVAPPPAVVKPAPPPASQPAGPVTKPAASDKPKPVAAETVEPIAAPSQPTKSTLEPVSSTETAAGEEAALKDKSKPSTAPIAQAQPIKRVAIVTGNYSHWAVGVVSLIGMVASALFLYRHSKVWRHSSITGEQLVIRHPVIDVVAVVAIVLVVVMIQNVGHIL